MGIGARISHGAVVGGALLRTAARRARRGPRRAGWSWRTELAFTLTRTTVMRSKAKGVPWLRDMQAAFPMRSAAVREVEFSAVSAGGVSALWCTPRGATERPRTVVYLHGGGYVIGSVESYRDTLARLALGADARVLGVGYRLAPEHPLPTACDDALAATRFALAAVPAASCAVAGDSAGGALAITTLCGLRDAGEPLPGAGVLISPWVDPYASGGTMEAHADCDFADRELLVGWIEQARGGLDDADPRVTPLRAELRGLPPLLIQAGGAEILLDQVRAFAERARAAGVDLELEVVPDMFHDFQMQAPLLPEGARAMDAIAAFLRKRLPDRI